MRRHRFISMLHITVRRCAQQRRYCTEQTARLKPIRRKSILRKRAS